MRWNVNIMSWRLEWALVRSCLVGESEKSANDAMGSFSVLFGPFLIPISLDITHSIISYQILFTTIIVDTLLVTTVVYNILTVFWPLLDNLDSIIINSSIVVIGWYLGWSKARKVRCLACNSQL